MMVVVNVQEVNASDATSLRDCHETHTVTDSDVHDSNSSPSATSLEPPFRSASTELPKISIACLLPIELWHGSSFAFEFGYVAYNQQDHGGHIFNRQRCIHQERSSPSHSHRGAENWEDTTFTRVEGVRLSQLILRYVES